MASQLHFVLMPLMCPGHLIPIVDIAKLLAHRNVAVTIVATPLNAKRFQSVVDRAVESGLPINVLVLKIPTLDSGLPEGCENVEDLPSMDLVSSFCAAMASLQEPLERFLLEAQPRPSCIVSDRNLAWTVDTARKLQITRILFDGTSCFNVVCTEKLYSSKAYEGIPEKEPFFVPGLPDSIQFTRAQLPGIFNPGSNNEMYQMRKRIREAEAGAYGVIVNSFEELEPEYARECRKILNKVWCIGPVSLINKEVMDKTQRGKKGSIDEAHCLSWLDSHTSGSVIYACLGSLNRLTPLQLAELGLGLESTNRPFIWVVRGRYKKEEFEEWVERDGFEERVKNRGLVIRGWAPQVLILSHPAIGGFLTHCGWNSTLEGVCAGVPMVTWPLFAEQFYNEKLIVEVLRIGVRVGADVVMHFGEEEEMGVLVTKEDVREAVDEMMGELGRDRQKRVRELATMARTTLEEEGSSYLNLTLLIEDLMQLVNMN